MTDTQWTYQVDGSPGNYVIVTVAGGKTNVHFVVAGEVTYRAWSHKPEELYETLAEASFLLPALAKVHPDPLVRDAGERLWLKLSVGARVVAELVLLESEGGLDEGSAQGAG